GGRMIFQEISSARFEQILRLTLGCSIYDPRRLPYQVDYATGGDVPCRPPCFTCVEAEVDIVKISIVALVQQSDVLKHILSDYHTGARHPIRLARLVRHRGRRHPPA